MGAVADDLALALELAELADAITLGRFRAVDLRVETKPDLTPVTDADRAVEQRLRDRISAVRPGDAVLGEESGESSPGGAGGRRWIIDPIDGTKNYVRGIPVWATLIALEDPGEVSGSRGGASDSARTGEEIGAMTVAVVSAPALGRRWWAVRDAGAFVDGQPIHVSGVSKLTDAQVSFADFEDWEANGRLEALLELGRRCWRTRGFGDFWSYMLVAEGAVDIGGLDPVVSLWDLAAPQLIVEEAGGRFTDLGGVRTADGGDAIATNGLLHDAALAIVGRPPPRPSGRVQAP
ncbi:MAG: inositol monophosphatase family protein [Solirubrobacteraceae bacterium]